MYFKYRSIDNVVVEISDSNLDKEENYEVISFPSSAFNKGDEFKFLIHLHIKEDEVIGHSALLQSPPAQELLKRNRELEERNLMLEAIVQNNHLDNLESSAELYEMLLDIMGVQNQ